MAVELLLRYLKLAVAVVVIWILMYVYGTYGCHKMKGPEMEPTIANDDFSITAAKARHPDQIMRDDVIIYEHEESGSAQMAFAGRVMGLPGDRIKIVKGDVYVNDQKVASNYVGNENRSSGNMPEVIVPRDHFFVLGDNRRNANRNDSRGIGPIHHHSVLGKIN